MMMTCPSCPEKPKTKRKRTGRNLLPRFLSGLPREIIDDYLTDEERCCDCCNIDKREMGYESSELIDFVPARLIVKEFRCHKFACPICEQGVVIAPVVDKLIDGGRPGCGLLAQIVLAKYEDHLPLYRQIEQFRRIGAAPGRVSQWPRPVDSG